MLKVEEQKQELLKLLQILNHIESTEILFGTLDEKYLAEKRSQFEWQYKSEIHRISVSVLNKGNARVYTPENSN